MKLMSKRATWLGVIGLLIVGGFYIFPSHAAWAGTVGLGGACPSGDQDECVQGLLCLDQGDEEQLFLCSSCSNNKQCQKDETCKGKGFCVKNSGNPTGAACSDAGDCVSKKCGANNRCQAGTLPVNGGNTGSPAGNRGSPSGSSAPTGINLTIQGIVNIITGITCWSIRAILAVMVIALIVAGVRFFLAGAGADVNAAKKNFNWVIIGIVVILSTNIIIATIGNAVTGGGYSYLPISCTQFK